MGSPTSLLFDAALRVLAYLGRHKAVGLRYELDDTPRAGMADSSWEVRHSTSGYTFQMNRCTISWASKKQPTIALSSCEAEVVAAIEAAKEAVYLDNLLKSSGTSKVRPNQSTYLLRTRPQSIRATIQNIINVHATSTASTTSSKSSGTSTMRPNQSTYLSTTRPQSTRATMLNIINAHVTSTASTTSSKNW